MSASLTIENALILACARTDPDLRVVEDLGARGPDWQELVRKAERWNLVPLVYANLRQSGAPVAIMEHLRRLHHRDATYAIAQRAVVRAVLASLTEADVPVVVLGGTALAATVYPSPALRPTRNIDLVVHASDRAEAEASVGGTAKSDVARIHVRDQVPNSSIPIDDVWANARPVEIESVAALVPSHEHLLIQLALDIGLRRAGPGPACDVRNVCDVAETCRRHGSAIDWNRLVALAMAYDVAEPLYWALRLAHDLVAAGVPSSALAELRVPLGDSPIAETFIDDVVRGWLSDEEACSPAETTEAAPASPNVQPRACFAPNVDAATGEVAVTYDNQTTTDGVGSQLHRIYGLYALSRALGVKYVHTPLARVDYQGFAPLITGRYDPDFVARYNAFYALPSDDFDLEACERVRVHVLTEETVEEFRRHAAATRHPVLLQSIHHYGYTDRYPAVFQALRAVSPYRAHRATGPVRVCIHLRRGDNGVPGRTDGQERLLPDDYYLRVCGTIVEALRAHEVPFVVRLHTEVPVRRFTLYPDTPGLFFRLNEPVTVDPSAYSLDAFAALPNLETVLNVDAREALDDFATADVLILSLSSLGYLGGLLNPHGLVVYAPWWHPALPDWLIADAHGNLDPALVSAHIGDHLRQRMDGAR